MTEIVVRPSTAADALVWVGLPLAGIGAGLLLSQVPGWSLQLPGWVFLLPFTPDRGQIEGLANLMGPTAMVVLAVLGLVLGLLLAVTAYDERTTVRVGAEDVTITLGDETIGSALRTDLSSALLEHGELVLMAKDGTEPVRVHSDLNRGRLRTAFERSGVRWLDKDPHETEFRRWIDGAPELDAYAHGILRSREKALESGQHQAARELREEASSQSLVVRDREGHQQWRRAATT